MTKYMLLMALFLYGTMAYAVTCPVLFDEQTPWILAEGTYGRMVYRVDKQDGTQIIRKYYPEIKEMENDLTGIQVLQRFFAKNKQISGVDVVKILGLQRENFVDLSFKEGIVIETLFETDRLSRMPVEKKNEALRLRQAVGLSPLDLANSKEAKEILNSKKIQSLRDRYETLIQQIRDTFTEFAKSENIQVEKIEYLEVEGQPSALYIVFRLPNETQSTRLYIKPDNMTVDTYLQFTIFDPH